MIKSLLSASLLLATASAGATSGAPGVERVNYANSVQEHKISSARPERASMLLDKGVSLSVKNGMKHLNVVGRPNPGKVSLSPAGAEATIPVGYVLYESFEGWDGKNINWTPEGWEITQGTASDSDETWHPNAHKAPQPAPAEGKYYYGINFSYDTQDEWLISPYVTVGDDMELSYWYYLNPLYLFNLDNVDWDKYDFTGDKEVAATLQIWAQAEGEDWVELYDHSDKFKDYSLSELIIADSKYLTKHTLSLNNYYGKKTRVAFRYTGSNGDTMFVDAIGIGLPSLEGVTYASPESTLYWGFDRFPFLNGISSAIAMYPVYSPLTWTNLCQNDKATFTWKYSDPDTGDFVTSENPEKLTVTYHPDYSSEETILNNLYYPPTLKAEMNSATPSEYQAPYVYFQAGGAPGLDLEDGTVFDPCLIPFNHHLLGVARTTVEDAEAGDKAVPVFGYDANTDKYWLEYALDGQEAQPGDYSKLEGIGNLFIPDSHMPAIVYGTDIYGFGQITDDAELTATVYALNSEMSLDYNTFEVVQRKKIKGSAVLSDDNTESNYICIPFDFDEPVVMIATKEHPAYLVMLEGFNSDKVIYFVPLQSDFPDPDHQCRGYILNHTSIGSSPAYYSVKQMTYRDNGEDVNLYSSFCLGLNIFYPWLTTDCTSIKLNDEQPTVEVPLGSYYDSSKLNVEAPEGISATVAGRYDKCILTVKRDDASRNITGNIIVKAPGVEVTIPVESQYSASVGGINADASSISEIYDLAGRRLQSLPQTSGVYIVKFSDGSKQKFVVK